MWAVNRQQDYLHTVRPDYESAESLRSTFVHSKRRPSVTNLLTLAFLIPNSTSSSSLVSTMASKAFDLIPLLRAPLLFNSGLGLILSAVAAKVIDDDWHWETAMSNIIDAIVAFYAASLVITAAFAYTDYRRGGLKLTQGRNLVATYLVKAGVDLATGIALLTLHILVSAHVGSVYGNHVLYMYAGFGALPAR